MRLVEQGRFLPLLGSAVNSFHYLERILTPNLSVQDRKNLFVASSSDQYQRLRDLLVDETCHDLMIESTEQMGDPGVWVSLYPNIRTIAFEGTLDITLPQGTETFLDVLIPFVAAFRRLDRIAFHDTVKILLVLSLQVPRVEGEEFVLQEAARPLHRLVETLCDAYASGSLPHTVRVLASAPPDHEEAALLFCPNPHATEMGCPLCRRVAQTFPVEHVLTLTPRGPVFNFRDVPSMFQTIGGNTLAGRPFPLQDEELC